jgi:hypothetical protein
MKAGAMERFVEESSEIMQAIDLQNGAFEEKGMKLLEKWEREGVPLLLGDGSEKVNPLAQTTSAAAPAASSTGDNQYKSMLKP